jgi:hypothetical protein
VKEGVGEKTDQYRRVSEAIRNAPFADIHDRASSSERHCERRNQIFSERNRSS